MDTFFIGAYFESAQSIAKPTAQIIVFFVLDCRQFAPPLLLMRSSMSAHALMLVACGLPFCRPRAAAARSWCDGTSALVRRPRLGPAAAQAAVPPALLAQDGSSRCFALALRGGAGAKRDKKEKTKNKRGGASAHRAVDWDASDDGDGGGVSCDSAFQGTRGRCD